LTKTSATDHDYTWTTIGTLRSLTLTQPIAGFTLTSSGTAITTTGTVTFALANDLAALEGLTGTGFAKRTGNDAWSVGALAPADITFANTARFFGRNTAGGGAGEELTSAQATNLINAFTATLKGVVNPPATVSNKYLRDDNSWQQDVRTITFVIDGGGQAIAAGFKGVLEIPFACTIDRWTILADQAGSAVVDIWRDTYAQFPPVAADTITGTAKPTLSSAQKAQSTTLTGWSTSLAADNYLGFNVDSASTVTRLTISLRVIVA
jgi:hypothetical protein